MATFGNVTIDRPGSGYRLAATAAAGGETAAFPVLVSIRFVKGYAQTGIAGFELGDSVVAAVQDPIGTPLPLVSLTWSSTLACSRPARRSRTRAAVPAFAGSSATECSR
jgi:hypothetical protein